jgi:hypothetical protein
MGSHAEVVDRFTVDLCYGVFWIEWMVYGEWTFIKGNA